MGIRVLFFGILGDATGHAEIMVNEDLENIRAVKEYLESNYAEIKRYQYRIALNGKISGSEDESVQSGDEIAFLPPFAGG